MNYGGLENRTGGRYYMSFGESRACISARHERSLHPPYVGRIMILSTFKTSFSQSSQRYFMVQCLFLTFTCLLFLPVIEQETSYLSTLQPTPVNCFRFRWPQWYPSSLDNIPTSNLKINLFPAIRSMPSKVRNATSDCS
jgi:hypothetical protein